MANRRGAQSRGHGSLDRLGETAAEQITGFHAPAACSASAADGVITEIRLQDARELHGVIPRRVHIPRTVLEWRIAVASPWPNLHSTSVLAASNLVQLGFYQAGDLIGGFEA
jgi:hypothetical protein